jgi:hypothetical protein
VSDETPWVAGGNPWDVDGKEFKDWTTTEALEVARRLEEMLKSDPELQEPLRSVLLPLIDWALDILEHYNEMTGDQVTLEEVASTFACFGIASPAFLSELLGNLALFKRKLYSQMDPCMIAAMAHLGICYLRNALSQTFAPDLLAFWLDGKAHDSANLRLETIQLTDANGQGFGKDLAFKPVESSFVMQRIGNLVYGALEGSYLSVLGSVCQRLHAPANKLFPTETTRVLHREIEIAPQRNALGNDGAQVLYNEVSFAQDSRVDAEFYILGTSGLLSEITVRAAKGTWTDPVGGADKPGWTVTVEAWRVRFWDYFDFHTGTGLYVPLGGGDLLVPDELFTRIRSGWDCSRYNRKPAIPGDYLLMSDSWIDVDVARPGAPRVFIPEGTDCDFAHEGTFYPLPPGGGS